MSKDDIARQQGKTIGRQSWSHVPGLSNLLKTDFTCSRRDRDCANKMVRDFTLQNPNATQVEMLNWFRVVILVLQIRMAANRNMLMSGQKVDDGHLTFEEFQEIKRKERASIPQLDKQLADALSKTGGTTQQRQISADIRTSAEAAQAVWSKYIQEAE